MYLLAYLWVVLQHKYFVFVAGRRIGVNMLQLVLHDWSKFTPSEFKAYAKHFHGKPSQADKVRFTRAWLYHQNRNPHHWEYWVSQRGADEPVPLHMPRKYVMEMLADWMAASRTYGGEWPKDVASWSWWQNTKNQMRLHPSTRAELELLMADKVDGARPE